MSLVILALSAVVLKKKKTTQKTWCVFPPLTIQRSLTNVHAELEIKALKTGRSWTVKWPSTYCCRWAPTWTEVPTDSNGEAENCRVVWNFHIALAATPGRGMSQQVFCLEDGKTSAAGKKITWAQQRKVSADSCAVFTGFKNGTILKRWMKCFPNRLD